MWEIRTWAEDTGFDDAEAIRHVKGFMKRKASLFYMYNVARNINSYNDLDALFEELYEYCFPPDMIARLRRKFNSLKQTDRGIKDFVREVQRYKVRLPDIGDRQLAQRVWDGAYTYLRIKWADHGMNAEVNSVEELLESGIRFEMSEKIRKYEEDRGKDRYTHSDKQRTAYKPSNRSESSTESNKVTFTKGSNTYKKNDNKKEEKKEWKPKEKTTPRLSKEKANEYCAAGKCFICGEVGHISRDCPKRNTARPSQISSSAIRFAHIEELGAKRQDLELNHVRLVGDEGELGDDEEESNEDGYESETPLDKFIEINAIKTKKRSTRIEVERNSATPKDFERKVASAIIVDMDINGQSCRVLLDSGSLGDFISSTVVDQLKIKTEVLAKPIGLTMAVAGSRGSIKHSATVNLKYRTIDEDYRLDIINIDKYNLILGTSFLHKHSIVLSFNPHGVHIRSEKALPMKGPLVSTMSSNAADLHEDELEKIREMLRKESEDICKGAAETPLPPLRVINHRIPLIDENKTYSWRNSRCPEALRGQWEKKLKAYLDTGRWEFATGKNAIPMLLIPKKGTEGESTLRTVLDKREQNANTYKVASPLPDMQVILWDVSKYPYRSLIDGKDAYEQIRIEPEDVHKTLFTTPSGTMVSYVMQIGDCNATSTYQSLMNSC